VGFCTDYTADSACQGAWLFTEGSGTTVDNAEGTSSYDGAFKGTGEPAWVGSVTGTNAPPAYATDCVDYDGSDDYISCGNVYEFADGAFSVGGWFNNLRTNIGSETLFVTKINNGGDYRRFLDFKKYIRPSIASMYCWWTI